MGFWNLCWEKLETWYFHQVSKKLRTMLVFVSLAPMSSPHFPVSAANLQIWAGLGNEVRQLFCLFLSSH